MILGFFMRMVRMAVFAAVVCAVTIFLTWTAVRTYVDKFLAAYHLDTLEQKSEFSDFLSSLGQTLNTLNGKEVPQNKQAAAADLTVTPTATPSPTSVPATAGAAGNPSPQPAADQAGSPRSDDAVPAMGQSRADAGLDASGAKQDVVLSAKDLNKKKEEISTGDKTRIFAILSASLPTDQVQHISTLVEDGITGEEMNEIQAIFQKYLKPDEIKQLTDILNRY